MTAVKNGSAALLALAERVEKEEPSNQLDAEVWDTIGLTDDQKRHCQKWIRMDGRTDLTRFDFLRAWTKCYTSGIDAAASLMPGGWVIRIGQIRFGMWRVEAWRGDKSFASVPDVDTAGCSEPQARSAVALRARAVMEGDET